MRRIEVNYARLDELERRFQSEVHKRSPLILAEILVSPQEVEELGQLIGSVLQYGRRLRLRVDYPLCTSLFLVWCTVYNYKEGNLWEPIFAQLGLEGDNKRRRYLGKVFLAALSHFGLLVTPPDFGKRYMSPILMHGYISDYYAPRFLNYLNAIYTSYLQYNVEDQALEGMWSDLFDLNEEHLQIQDQIDKLMQEEQLLHKEAKELLSPVQLEEDPRPIIDQLKNEMEKAQQEIDSYQRRLVAVREEIQELEVLYGEFSELGTALAAIDEYAAQAEGEPQLRVGDLGAQVGAAFDGRLAALRTIEREIERSLRTSQNRHAVTRDRRVNLMTAIVTLGKGKMSEGYSILDEYLEIKAKIESLAKQRQQRERLLSYDQELGSTSVRQILTASLTTLAQVNQQVFRDFIASSLRMLDSISRGKGLPQDHRMTAPMQRWFAALGEQEHHRKREQLGARPRISADARHQAEPGRVGRRVPRIDRIRLRPPSLVFDGGRRELLLVLPEQQLLVPPKAVPEIECAVDYESGIENVRMQWQIQNNHLYLQALEIPIARRDLRGLRLRWFNLSEYWSIELDEVMVFNAKGELQEDRQLNNGYYYVLADTEWRVDIGTIVDSYPCRVPNYVVYELQLAEAQVRFFSADGKERLLSASRYSGIKLENVWYTPGVTYDGMPVGKGLKKGSLLPYLAVSRTLLESGEPDLTLELYHNGARLHHQEMKKAVERFGRELTPLAAALDLERLIPAGGRSDFETITVEVKDSRGDMVFTAGLCVARKMYIRHDDGEIRISLPATYSLQHPKARREGKQYCIPTDDRQEEVRVFFPRIGWKNFSIEVPGGHTQLFTQGGQNIEAPLAILPSQSHLLENLWVRFTAASRLVRRVRVADSNGRLDLGFNLRRNQVDIPLQAFADLFRDTAERAAILLEWEGELGSSGTATLVDVFPRITVQDVEVYTSEQEDEYILELRLTTEFPDVTALRFRLRDAESQRVLFDRRVRSIPDHFYVRRNELLGFNVQAELYYTEEITSVFGTEAREQNCWSKTFTLPNRKALLQRARKKGIILKSFKYGGRSYQLPKTYPIVGISLSEQNFEGEELLRGYIQLESGFQEVFFYLDREGKLIPFLEDSDGDGATYDLREERILWELSRSKDVIGPLDDFEFAFLGEDES